MAKKDVPTRGLRHSQTPIMVDQMRALRDMARRAGEGASQASLPDQIGAILTSNMLAGFALELGLKLFFMSFKETPPPGTHNLKTLFDDFPLNWRTAIDSAYRSDSRSRANYLVTGFQMSGTPPATSQEDVEAGSFGSADAFFDSVSLIFVRSRYFFEEVFAAEWVFVTHPIEQMLAMIDVLDAFYHHVLREAAWGNPAG